MFYPPFITNKTECFNLKSGFVVLVENDKIHLQLLPKSCIIHLYLEAAIKRIEVATCMQLHAPNSVCTAMRSHQFTFHSSQIYTSFLT